MNLAQRRRVSPAVPLAMLGLLLAACSDPDGPQQPVPDPARSTVTASPTSVTANGSSTSTITVQLKDAQGSNLTTSSGTVTLAKTGGGTLSAVSDNGNGTYAATLTAPATVGQATVTAALNGQALGSPATVTFTPGPAASLVRVPATPDPITGITAGANATLTVRALDANANPVPGVVIDFTLLTGGGSRSPASATTNAQGEASTTLTTGSIVGTNTVRATAQAGTAASTTFAVVTVAGAPSLAQSTVAAAPSPLQAGATSTITVQLKDAFGNNLTASAGTVTLARTGVGTISAVTDNNNGTYTATLTANVAGSATVTASLNGQALTHGANPITVVFLPGLASLAQSTVAATPTTVIANGTSFSTITVQLKDAFGNNLTASGGTVTLALTGSTTGVGTLSPVTDNANGTYTARLTSPTGGTAVVTASLNGQPLTNASNPVDVEFVTGAAVVLEKVTPDPTGVTAGQATTLTVRALDGQSNPVAGVAVAFAAAGGGSVAPTPVTTDAQGLASTTLTTSATVGLNVVSATVPGTGITTIFSTQTLAGAAVAARSSVSASPTSTTATGVSVSAITVQLRDANNNPTNVGGPPTLSLSGVGTLSAVAAQGGGVYTASLTSVAAGAAVVTASVGGEQIPGSPVTVTFVPDVLARLDRVTPDPTTGIVAGQSTLLTVRAVDAQGNPIAGVTIDFAATAGGGSLSPASANTDLSGLASATLTTGTTVGTNTVTAAVRSNPAISTTFTVQTAPGAATALLKVTVDPSTVIAGSTTTLTVRAVDVNGNPRPGVTVSFGANNGGAVTTPTTTDAQGLASTSLTTSTSVGVTHTVTATASGANVVGSPATAFSVTTTVAAAVARLAAPAPGAATPAAPPRRR